MTNFVWRIFTMGRRRLDDDDDNIYDDVDDDQDRKMFSYCERDELYLLDCYIGCTKRCIEIEAGKIRRRGVFSRGGHAEHRRSWTEIIRE